MRCRARPEKVCQHFFPDFLLLPHIMGRGYRPPTRPTSGWKANPKMKKKEEKKEKKKIGLVIGPPIRHCIILRIKANTHNAFHTQSGLYPGFQNWVFKIQIWGELCVQFLFMSLYYTQKIWILGCPKSTIGCPKDTWIPLWLKACTQLQTADMK